MVLCETGKDMNTPLSVRKVLEWAKQNPVTSKKAFDEIESYNESLIKLIEDLNLVAKNMPELYNKYRKQYSKLCANEICKYESQDDQHVLPILKSIIETYDNIRNQLKWLSKETDTPIEPEIISTILDEMKTIPGILVAGAPGAGGFDALFCFALDDANYSTFEKFLLDYKDLPLSPLLTREDKQGLHISFQKSESK